ncbi:hypothetical protein LCGC14_1150150 [marine sediment metagenome]|uniref:Uncharacterized protein n=1 Tax=marine sediment metagenome TaxID=412755 RepID=A0A0F9Q1D1_9ZZZZ
MAWRKDDGAPCVYCRETVRLLDGHFERCPVIQLYLHIWQGDLD